MGILALIQYLAILAIPFIPNFPVYVRIGVALIVFSPQWLYVFSPVPHLVFEFRGYGMAAGVAILAAGLLEGYRVLAVALFLFWAWRSLVRRRILTSPIAFWRRVEEENSDA